MTQPTYEDAELILKLYDLRREERLRSARAWFFANFSARSFAEAMEKYPPGSDQNAYMRMVGTYWDMAASFVVRGILHDELFFESSGEMLAVWEKMKDFIYDMRNIRKNPTLYRNLEKGALKQIAWLERQAPEAYEGIKAMFAPKK
jgi:hypothetical protein